MNTRPRCALLIFLGSHAAALLAASSATPAPAAGALPAVPQAAPADESAKATAATKSPAPALAPRFQQIRDRIEALFSGRLETPPPPDPHYNPFRAIGAGPPIPVQGAAVGGETTPSTSLSSDLAILQQAAATLKVRGTIERAGRSQLQVAINSGPNRDGTYKEGDVLTVIVQDQPYHLRVRQITRYSVMFSLNDAEYTLKF